MNEKKIIEDFHQLIFQSIKKQKLCASRDLIKDSPFFIGQKMTDASLDYNITRDIANIQTDLIYLTGILYTLKPYINNPLKENGRYLQNLYDSLFTMYASHCFEVLYNFWDRIGDKIATEYPFIFTEKRDIMFANVIDKLKNETDPNIEWLRTFRDNDFKDFNEKRKRIVHYEQIQTKYKETIINNRRDKNRLKEIWEDKSDLPNYFKKHIELTNEGIIKTYQFVQSRS